ncbi:DUF5134 domain-containing protein [Streptomyces sp. NPDC048603]|uniref:DUF5134 domain-containing protein n=1 Tax=Streptomyces sp. NPDC048603 TaxID=3365577 RepID=UPI0037119413
MHHSAPPLPSWLLVLLCAASGAYCLLRGRGPADRADGVMGLGMAAMAVPQAAGVRGFHLALGAVFCVASVHALWQLRAGGRHHAHHLVGSLAMVHMAFSPGARVLTGALLLYYTAYVLLSGVRLVPGPAPAAAVAGAGGGAGGTAVAGGTGEPAGLTRACRLAMGMGMFAMLLLQ